MLAIMLAQPSIANTTTHTPYEHKNRRAVVRGVHCTYMEERRGEGTSSISVVVGGGAIICATSAS